MKNVPGNLVKLVSEKSYCRLSHCRGHRSRNPNHLKKDNPVGLRSRLQNSLASVQNPYGEGEGWAKMAEVLVPAFGVVGSGVVVMGDAADVEAHEVTLAAVERE